LLIGVLDAIVEIFLLVYIAVALQNVLNNIKGGLMYLLVCCAIFLAIKTISVIHSVHFIQEFIPRKKEIQTDPSAVRSRPSNQNQDTQS
jgi:hypothetical protein